MSKKPIIGITVWTVNRIDPHPGRFIHSNVQYMKAIRECGGVPVYISGSTTAEDELAEMLDGVIFSGGEDIDPKHYGEATTYSEKPDAQRDEFELSLARKMISMGKPVLGICRGCQVVNVATGGTLYQDNDKELGTNHPSGHGKRHELVIDDDCFMKPFFHDCKTTVNSTHHQSVKTTGEGIKITGRSEDGVAEVIEAKDGRPIFGVQFHPERIFEARGESILGIFRTLVDAAK